MERALSSFSSLLEVMMTRSPAALASCSANTETPPVPCSRTVSPGTGRECSNSACQAVTPAQGKAAPCSSVSEGGTATNPSSEKILYSLSTPLMDPPKADANLSRLIGPSIHFCMKQPATRSSFRQRVTSGPIASTRPTPSESGIMGRFNLGLYTPFATIRSRKFKDAAVMRTSTCPAPGCGTSRSVSLRLSMPNSCISNVFMGQGGGKLSQHVQLSLCRSGFDLLSGHRNSSFQIG